MGDLNIGSGLTLKEKMILAQVYVLQEEINLQINSTYHWKKFLRKWKFLYPEAKIVGHRDTITNKTCPNFDVKTWAKDKFT